MRSLADALLERGLITEEDARRAEHHKRTKIVTEENKRRDAVLAQQNKKQKEVLIAKVEYEQQATP